MKVKRKSIKNLIEYSGIGLHKGKDIKIRLLPAKSGEGIVFIRTDLETGNIIKLDITNVFDPIRGTNIRNQEGAMIHTIEHFLSALYINEITDLIVEISGNELPVADGSSFPYLELFEKAGIKELDEKIEEIIIKEPIHISEGDKHIVALPYDGYKITYSVDYGHSFLKSQHIELEINKETYTKEISKARTFGFDYELKYLKENNLALGGSLENAIVVTKDGILNPDGLRYENEFVRHKVLDIIGDLKVLNRPIRGHIIALKAGHAIDIKFAKLLLKI